MWCLSDFVADVIRKLVKDCEFVTMVSTYFSDYRKKNAAKKFATKGKEANKKRKMEEETQNGEVAVEDEGDAEEVAADAEANGDDSDK